MQKNRILKTFEGLKEVKEEVPKKITLKEVYKKISMSGKVQEYNFTNITTGLRYTYRIEQAKSDPLDWESPRAPKYIYIHIGEGEWAYIGALYEGKDFMIPEDGIYKGDRAEVKIFRYILKCMIKGDEPEHIEATVGIEYVEDYAGRLTHPTCVQTMNMQTANMSNSSGRVTAQIGQKITKYFCKNVDTSIGIRRFLLDVVNTKTI